MNLIKGLLLGSTATIVAVAGAQAADLPVKAKPVEYVKVCSAYGVGFFYIPGTQSCMRISGYFRNDIMVNSAGDATERVGAIPSMQRNRDYFDNQSRGSFSFDVRNNTQYGVMRVYYNEYITTDSEKTVTPTLSSAYLQLAGFTVGRFIETYATAWDTDIGSYTTNSYTARDTSQSQGIEYRAQFGGGVSAAIGLMDPRRDGIYDRNDTMIMGAFPTSQPILQTAGDNGYHMPDIEGDVRIEQAWGGAHFGALLHQDNVVYNSLNQPALSNTVAISNGSGGFLTTLANNMGNPVVANSESLGYPKTKYGYAFNASLNLTQLPTGQGDKFTVSGQYTKGDILTIQGSSPVTSFALFGPGNNSGFYNSTAFGYYMDSVFDSSGQSGDNSQHLTQGWEVSAGFEHYWIPAVLRTSFYGNYEGIHYDAFAKNAICTTTAYTTYGATGAETNFAAGSRFGFTPGSVCNPDFHAFVVGSRTAWNVTPDLEVSGDIMYNGFITASSGALTAIAPAGIINNATQLTQANQTLNSTAAAGKPVGAGILYNIKNQGELSFFTRIQRSW